MAFVKYFLAYALCAAAIAVVVYGVADPTTCIQCDDYDTCADTVDTEKVTGRCNLTDGQECGRYSYNDTKGTRTVRDCFNSNLTCENQQTVNKDNIKDNSTWECYRCDTDLCNKENSAGSIGVSVVAMVATVVASLYLK